MTENIKEIALAFSNGKFESVYSGLSEDIIWNIAGERTLSGKDEVTEYCNSVAEYFKSVTTDFKTYNVIVSDDKVAVNGKAEFIRDGKKISVVESCDVYEFDKEGMLHSVTSYCINLVKGI
ncbi:MAG: nuclear transport factor 2 family protein [Ignavibacteria bacterium]|nr:nuclear transport factor 2 family protein [Ignavibacteria bacterium]